MVSMKEMGRLDAERQPPAWFHPLLATTFFEPCPKHPATTGGRWTRTSGCNLFCADCSGDALCSGACLGDHSGHHLIQVHTTSRHGKPPCSILEISVVPSMKITWILKLFGIYSDACVRSLPVPVMLQIRRSSCHNLVKVADLERLQLNVRFVQTYVYNNEAAVFLNKRGVSGKEKPGQIRCEGCNWGLMDSECRFCSLRCKVRTPRSDSFLDL
ncbi:hypothetical protein HU200_006190 [Digitaria exilis]|uniref:Uncharacterized protein n=1 Tax=Digitaria exilis TaxID=1010633 RepID=A0A835KVL0_9POAL|nr:hypothetical protein HU200_006190 [Digitaria exilis]